MNRHNSNRFRKLEVALFLCIAFCRISFAQYGVNISPCPNIFQYGFTRDGSVVGSMKMVIPRTKVYGFNITQEFVSLESRLRKIPNLKFRENENQVIENILTGKEVHFITDFPFQSLDFELVSIKINGKEVCNLNAASNSISKSVVQTDLDFNPPSKVFSSFKQHFKINLKQPNCGILNKQNLPSTPSYGQLSHGGEHVNWSEFPWVASVFVFGEYKCTANLITKNTALTAAHCFDKNLSYKNIQIKLYNGKTASVWGYLNHQYHVEYKNDISLVFLEDDINDHGFSPVCIGSDLSEVAGKVGDLVSFGENEVQEVGKIARVPMPAVTNDECKSSNGELSKLVQSNHFCAGSRDGSGPCDGDSGGGWSVEQNGKWHLRGILSTGLKNKESGVCDNFNYAMFMDVNKFLGWITNDNTLVPEVTSPPTQSGSNSFLFESCGDIESSPSGDSVDISNGNWLLSFTDRLDNLAWVAVPIAPKWALFKSLTAVNIDTPERYYVKVKDSDEETGIEKIIYHEKYNASSNNYFNMVLLKLLSPLPDYTRFFCVDNLPYDIHEKKVNGIWTTSQGEQELMDITANSYSKCDEVFWLQINNFCVPRGNTHNCNSIIYEKRTSPVSHKSYWALLGIGSVHDDKTDTCLYANPVSYFDWIKDKINQEENKVDRPALHEDKCGDFGNTRFPPDYSWGVRLYNREDNLYYISVLVAPNWVVSKAQPGEKENFYVKKIRDGLTVEIEKKFVHEKFNGSVDYSDNSISLFKLQQPLASYKYFCIDHLATRLQRSKLSGLGYEGEKVRKVLDLPILNATECADRTGYAFKSLQDNMFCVPDETSGNQCPEIAFDSHSTAEGKSYWSVVGISCAFKRNVDKKTCFYTDVAYHIDWIKDKINNH